MKDVLIGGAVINEGSLLRLLRHRLIGCANESEATLLYGGIVGFKSKVIRVKDHHTGGLGTVGDDKSLNSRLILFKSSKVGDEMLEIHV